MDDINSLSHSQWRCKYHIVFAPKYRRQVLLEQNVCTNEILFERLKKEGLSPLTREYIIDKINLRQVQKDCLISYVGKDVAVVALDNMLAAYYEGRQIALPRISYQRKDMVVNPQHYKRLALKQTIDAENVLLELGKVIDPP